MVSGRLGNDVYDFAVMADNKLPESALQAPWQSAASMFPETWSYRSWQKRGSVDDKVAEKLRSLIKVVSHGGNYLLNIGPASDGSIVPFEREVLLKIGSWLEENGDAIYGTQPSPFREEFAWGDVTMKGDDLYLLLTGTYPKEGYIELKFDKIGCHIPVDRKMFADPADVHVIKTDIKGELRRDVSRTSAEETLSWKNATPDYSYSCFDYYSNYRSTVAYNWLVVNKKPIKGVRLRFALTDHRSRVRLQLGEHTYEDTLYFFNDVWLKENVKVVSKQYGRMRGGTFDCATNLDGVMWEDVTKEKYQTRITPFSNHLMKVVLNAQKPCRVHLAIIAGNGMELLIRDNVTGEYVSMMKHLNPYRAKSLLESVILDLEKGDNEIVLRSYNRFEDTLVMYLQPHPHPYEYEQILMFDEPVDASHGLPVRISSADNESLHTDCKLHNVQIELIY
jgi:alpha-L-fucosidase